jgi:hypothetical protein
VILSEEVDSAKASLVEITNQICDMVAARSEKGTKKSATPFLFISFVIGSNSVIFKLILKIAYYDFDPCLIQVSFLVF